MRIPAIVMHVIYVYVDDCRVCLFHVYGVWIWMSVSV